MFQQLLIGSIVMALSLALIAAFIGLANAAIDRLRTHLNRLRDETSRAIILFLGTLWILTAISAAVWIWAAAFLILDLFPGIEPALYFAIVSFTTLGFGDVLLPAEWELLSGMCAANGLLIFGVTTAFLVELFSRLYGFRNK